jgi:hypothetical protein
MKNTVLTQTLTLTKSLCCIPQQLLGRHIKCSAKSKKHGKGRLILSQLQLTNVSATNISAVRQLFLRKAKCVATRFNSSSKRLNEKDIAGGMHPANVFESITICTRLYGEN